MTRINQLLVVRYLLGKYLRFYNPFYMRATYIYGDKLATTMPFPVRNSDRLFLNHFKSPFLLFAFFYLMAALGCGTKKTTTLFTAIPANQSGIHFQNTIKETEAVNLITNEYTYMGGGVGVGDFNNDGLQDVFFSANQASCKLYINGGNFTFKDVTESAGLTTSQWCTGVSVADINNDGFQDIYLSISGPVSPGQRKNKLYINNGNLTFTEMAAAYGLDDTSHSTQAAFLDYDSDGLLDVFLLTHEMQGESMNRILPKLIDGSSPRNDKLFRNEGLDLKKGHPVFKNVTAAAGIQDDGYGLGVAISDLNGDAKPDIYVSNDYIGNDCMWINNGDGTFSNAISKSLNHQSYSSMGTDAADINNDGLPDIATLDMMPEDNYRKKMMYSILNNERHQLEKFLYYEPSFIQNTLQLNRGIAAVNDTVVPVFSDIAHFAGVAETDWSWSVLAADFNNDGFKDLHITNGMGRDMINADFIAFRSSVPAGSNNNGLLLQELQKLDAVALPNYFFSNNHNYAFVNESAAAGIGEKAISNGAAYADFDNDGDLDLVVNNINSKAYLFSNNTIDAKNSKGNYIGFQLKGPAQNRDGLGSILKCYVKDSIILLEQNPVRGYLSTIDKRLYTGLGNNAIIDSVQITWPDGTMQTLQGLKANQVIVLDHKNANGVWQPSIPTPALFADYTKQSGVNFLHQDPYFFDYHFQRLLPQKYSSLGPGVAVGDVNGDGLEDFFVGNGYNTYGKLFIQNAGGTFAERTLESGEKYEEDTGCEFLDADSDGDLDLLVTSGTNEFEKESPSYLPRLYNNDGKGNFNRNPAAIPAHVSGVTAVIKTADFDGDGDLDVFLGGRIASGAYPAPPPSYLLQNNQGIFTDVTTARLPALANAGMITDAAFTDVDGNKRPDLVLVGEWMPVRVFKNTGNAFTEITEASGLSALTGMWRSLAVSDMDKDGDIDLVVGNLGLNNKYHFNAFYPLNMWYVDVDGNGSTDPIMAYYLPSENGKRELFPAKGLGDLAEQVPLLKKKYLLNKDFSLAKMEAVFENLAKPNKLSATEAASCWFENTGNGIFKQHALPVEAQLAPVNCILVNDYNNDGINDILLAGNEYQSDVSTGYYDAGYGLLLLGATQKGFRAVPHNKSGIFLRGDTRCLRTITVNNKSTIVSAINKGPVQLFQPNAK